MRVYSAISGWYILGVVCGVWLVLGCDDPFGAPAARQPGGLRAEGVQWSEPVGDAVVQLEAAEAVWRGDRGVDLRGVSLRWGEVSLAAERARFGGPARAIRGKRFALRRGGVQVKGKRVVVELENKEIRAWGVELVLDPRPAHGGGEPPRRGAGQGQSKGPRSGPVNGHPGAPAPAR